MKSINNRLITFKNAFVISIFLVFGFFTQNIQAQTNKILDAGSAIENMFDDITSDGDPVDNTRQTNFLSKKTGSAIGGVLWSYPGNSILLFGDHDDGTLPYSYQYTTDPFIQFIGIIDEATENDSEQIFIPVVRGGWNTETKVYVWEMDYQDVYETTMDLVAADINH